MLDFLGPKGIRVMFSLKWCQTDVVASEREVGMKILGTGVWT
jgi:hypothetical protein